MNRRARHTCAGPGCGRAIESWQRLCGACWARLPADQRQAIQRAREAKNALKVAELVRAAVAWLAAPPVPLTDRMLGEPPP
jgi:hypothetical protein